MLKKKTKLDAVAQAFSIYRLNAPSAAGYAFTQSNDEVNIGEFIYPNELPSVTGDRFDGYLDFKERTVTDLKTQSVENICPDLLSYFGSMYDKQDAESC